MSIFFLAVIGYVAGFAGSMAGAWFDLQPLNSHSDHNRDVDQHGDGGFAFVIMLIIFWKVITCIPLQVVKVAVSIGCACALHSESDAWLLEAIICGAAGFVFMCIWPPIARWYRGS